jgi:hypothetical protein
MKVMLVDVDEARTIGRQVRQIRDSRGKSLRVIAGLAGTCSTRGRVSRPVARWSLWDG